MMQTIKAPLCQIWQTFSILNDKLFRNGCDFGAWVEPEESGFSPERGNKYQPCNGALTKVLADCHITAQDRMIDIGCGKGRAMALMRRYCFAEVFGFDLAPQLVETARKNFVILQLDACTAVQADAAAYTDYDRFNYIYLFNSLPRPIFEKAMQNLCESLKRSPRRCTLIYLNPEHEAYLLQNTPFRHTRTRKAWSAWYEYRVYEAEPQGK